MKWFSIFSFLIFSYLVSSVASADELDKALIPSLTNVYQQLTEQSHKAKLACDTLKESIDKEATAGVIKANFKKLVGEWKRVQSVYVVSDFDDEAIDLPHYVDVFNRGNEDLESQIKKIILGNQPAKTALFKHSFKTINALEYVLFYENSETLSARQISLAKVIAKNICKRLTTIEDKYHELEADFVKKPKKAVAILLNELIASSYKLKEWRVGDAAGLSRKRNKQSPNKKFLEYRVSGLSIYAMQEILDVHYNFTDKDGEFSKIITILAKNDDTEVPLKALADAHEFSVKSIEYLSHLEDKDLVDEKAIKPLSTLLNNLHDSYFVELIESLTDIVARILDSDGD